jgi:hypothetical protein
MHLFGDKTAKPMYGALVDIGSDSVGIGIVSYEENAAPVLVYAHRISLRILKNKPSRAEHIRRVCEGFFSASLILAQEGIPVLQKHSSRARISKLYITCSSPWSYTIVENVEYKNEETFRVTPAIIKDLVETAEEEIFTKLREVIQVQKDDFDVVERITTDISVNDYSIRNYLNKKGNLLSLTHIAGLVPNEIIKSIYEVQDKLFPDTELRVHTSMLAMFCVARDVFPNTPSFCIIDVTGEATEFGFVENAIFAENTYIPYGSHTIIRDVMESTGKPAADIVSNLRAYEEGSGLAPAEFTDEITSYEAQVVQALEQVMQKRILPNHLVITTHNHHQRFFADLIAKAYKKVTGRNPSQLSLKLDALREGVPGVAEDDRYLALYGRFFHKLHEVLEPEYRARYIIN